MKKIIIAIFIVIATLGIAAGTVAKKAPVKTTTPPKKSTSTPKKEVTDPYVGWWYHAYDAVFEQTDEAGGYDDTFLYDLSKEGSKYYVQFYFASDLNKVKNQKMCKNTMGDNKYEINPKEFFQNYKSTNMKRATKEQVENLKYIVENGKWISKKECDKIN